MKRNVLLLLANAALWMAPAAFAQNSAFTYQGRLDDGGRPATGLYEMTFSLHGTAEGGTAMATTSPPMLTPVTNGLFTAQLNFGSAHFNGSPRWMQVSVRSNGVPMAPVPLLPRTALGSAPLATYAEMAGSVASGGAVKSLNNLRDDVTLAAGNNITLNTSGNTITVGSTGGAFSLNGTAAYYTAGSVGIGTATPSSVYRLDVLGDQRVRGNVEIQSGGYLGLRGATTEDALGTFFLEGWAPAGIQPPTRFTVKRDGKVGIGTANPQTELHLSGTASRIRMQSARSDLWTTTEYQTDARIWHTGVGGSAVQNGINSKYYIGDFSAGQVRMVVDTGGNVGLGTVNPVSRLHVFDGNGDRGTVHVGGTGANGDPKLIRFGDGDYVHIGENGSDDTMELKATRFNFIGGAVSVPVLTITGADFSERFDIAEAEGAHEPGKVVCIDPDHPGKLLLSSKAYDSTVAGIVSGAGGVKPGIFMGQPGTLADGQHPVALSGRVYAFADASTGPIQPGDLLTTSDTPGHMMKAADRDRAPGTILGKAMTALKEGTGLVLVLVNLQ